MEPIYNIDVNDAKPEKPIISTNPPGPTSSERRCHGAVVIPLSLLGVFLLAGLIGLGLHYHDSTTEFSSVRANLSERLQISKNNSLSLTEERDQLNSTLIEVTDERDELQSLNHDLAAELSSVKANLSECLQTSLSLTEERDELYSSLAKKQEEVQRLSEHNRGLAAQLSSVKASLRYCQQTSSSLTRERDQLKSNLNAVTNDRNHFRALYYRKNTCPSGWRMFSGSCYLLSSYYGNWDTARQDCRRRGADLVVVDKEQTFLSSWTSDAFWIGLTDKWYEGVWRWVDGTPLTLAYWHGGEPNNHGNEDCAHVLRSSFSSKRDWNDGRCNWNLRWICERKPY